MYRAIKSVPPVDPSAFKASVIPIPYKNPPNNTFRTRSSKKGVKEKLFKKNDTSQNCRQLKNTNRFEKDL